MSTSALTPELEQLIAREVERRIAAQHPDAVQRAQNHRWNLEQGKRSLESGIHAKTTHLTRTTDHLAELEVFFGGMRDVLGPVAAEAEALRAKIVEANRTGADRRPFERPLDGLEQILDGILNGHFTESGDLEDRLRALGIPPSRHGGKYFAGRRSLARTEAMIVALRGELDRTNAELTTLRADLAETDRQLAEMG